MVDDLLVVAVGITESSPLVLLPIPHFDHHSFIFLILDVQTVTVFADDLELFLGTF